MEKRLKHWILYPVPLSAFSFLNLLAYNVSEVPFLFALRPLIFAVVFPLLSLIFFQFFVRNWRKAALLTGMVVVIFYIHGRLYDVIEDSILLGVNVGRHRTLALLWVIVLASWIYYVQKKAKLSSWTFTLNVISLVLITLPIVSIIYYNVQLSYKLWAQAQQHHPENKFKLGTQNITKPDIYYIILDTYTRHDILEKELQFSNDAFVEILRQDGFYVADCSQSNYDSTSYSLVSSLNMDYLDSINSNFVDKNAQVQDIYPYLQNNSIMTLLKNQGYEIVTFDSGYSPTNIKHSDRWISRENDVSVSLSIHGLNPFESMALQTTAGAWLYEMAWNNPDLRKIVEYPMRYPYIIHRERMLYGMENLPEIAQTPAPKFVFLHLLAPHNPFVFDANGGEIIRIFAFTLNNDLDAQPWENYVSGYTGEVQYLNNRFEKIVSDIIASSETPPIIIIQGDHGIPRLTKTNENHAILNAYLLPGDGKSALYPSISPVNSFRVILNEYFDADLPLLEDRACRFVNGNSSVCEIVQDPNPNCVIH